MEAGRQLAGTAAAGHDSALLARGHCSVGRFPERVRSEKHWLQRTCHARHVAGHGLLGEGLRHDLAHALVLLAVGVGNRVLPQQDLHALGPLHSTQSELVASSRTVVHRRAAGCHSGILTPAWVAALNLWAVHSTGRPDRQACLCSHQAQVGRQQAVHLQASQQMSGRQDNAHAHRRACAGARLRGIVDHDSRLAEDARLVAPAAPAHPLTACRAEQCLPCGAAQSASALMRHARQRPCVPAVLGPPLGVEDIVRVVHELEGLACGRLVRQGDAQQVQEDQHGTHRQRASPGRRAAAPAPAWRRSVWRCTSGWAWRHLRAEAWWQPCARACMRWGPQLATPGLAWALVTVSASSPGTRSG